MSIDVARIAGLLVGTTTLSLFTTIVAVAAVPAASLRWDGSFCTARHCPVPAYAASVRHKNAMPPPVLGHRV